MPSYKHFKPYEGDAPYIFISYAHADADEVMPIVADMHAHGYNIWYDEGIEVGSEWQECIASHLVDAHLVIAFISNAYMVSDNCRREMHYALNKHKKVINVFIQETKLTPGMEMQIGNIFALMKYTFPGESVFYDKLYSAPLLLSENFSGEEGAPKVSPVGAAADRKRKREAKKLEKERSKAEKKKPEAKRKKKKIAALSITLAVLGLIIAGLIVAYFTGYLGRFLTETKTIAEPDGQTAAEFTEPVFEAAAREYTGIENGDIKVADLKGLTALYICGDSYWLNAPLSVSLPQEVGISTAEVTTAQGEALSVTMGNVEDLSDLYYFVSLRTLHLQFQSLNSLETMPICGIENLDISGCRVASLKGISDLPELRSITANGSSLTELGDLNACLHLSSASFIGGSVTDYSVFKTLSEIRDIAFSNCAARDFKQVLDHSSLRKVELYDCDLSGRFFNMFDNEDAITGLSLHQCRLENLDGMQEFANLTELTLNGCTGIPSYTVLAGLPSLKTVHADADTAKELKSLSASFAVEILKN